MGRNRDSTRLRILIRRVCKRKLRNSFHIRIIVFCRKECESSRSITQLVKPARGQKELADWRKAWIHQSVRDKLDFIRLQLSYLEAADIEIRSIGLVCLSHLTQGTLLFQRVVLKV